MGSKKLKMTRYLKYSVIGIELSASVIVGALVGYWLDSKLGTQPWFLIFWLICGIIAGFRSLFRMAKNIIKENSLENDSQRSG